MITEDLRYCLVGPQGRAGCVGITIHIDAQKHSLLRSEVVARLLAHTATMAIAGFRHHVAQIT